MNAIIGMTNIVIIEPENLINRGEVALIDSFMWKSGPVVTLPKNETVPDVPEFSICKVLDITSHIKAIQNKETLDMVEAVFRERYLPHLTEADCALLMEDDDLSRIKSLAEISMRIDLELAQKSRVFKVIPGKAK